jgi:carboxypeptidase C (cathepsin A)
MYLNGITMISPVVDFSTIRFANNNELPYITFLPSYAATAWHHQRLGAPLQEMPLTKVVAKAEKFAYGKYSRALLLGTSLSEEERARVAQRYALLTGLSPDFVLRNNLRVEMSRFAKELLRDEGKTVGRFDSRYTGIDRDNADDRYSYDPSSAAMSGIFAAGLNHYLRRVLKYEDERVYEISGSVQPWSYGSFENRYVDASETLRQAMSTNPHLQLFVACGHYDLATPQLAMRYTVDHLMLAPQYQSRIETKHYQAGHMMYILDSESKKLRQHLVDFYERATSSESR